MALTQAAAFITVVTLLTTLYFFNKSLGGVKPTPSDDRYPAGFVNILEVAPTVQLDIRYFTEHNFVGRKIRGYEAPACILTRPAAQALAKVQRKLLSKSKSLKIYDCYRPQRAVQHFVEWARDINDTLTKAEFYPTEDKALLFEKGYIAEKSGHSRGSTVDLTIVPLPVPEQEAYDRNNQRACFLERDQRFGDNSIDMGSGFDCFHEKSHTDTKLITEEQKENRELLEDLMEDAGFKNYDQEWWHYTLKKEPFKETYFDFVVRN